MKKVYEHVLINLLVLLGAIGCVSYKDNEKRIPPKILEKWLDVDFFQVNFSHSFNCIAEGTNLTFELYKENQVIYENKNGIFILESKNRAIEGIYHCRVMNLYGTAMTDKTNLKKAVSVVFPRIEETINITKTSDPLGIKCKPNEQVVPDPVVTWYRNIGKINEKIVFSKDVQFDGKDTLYFANAENHISFKYFCSASNEFLRTAGNSSNFGIKASSNKTEDVPPALLTTSSLLSSSDPTTVIGFTNGTVTMRCLFAGYPTPDITWHKKGSSSIIDRWHYKHDSTEISSSHPLDASYEGTYTCKGSNSKGENTHDIRLIVVASPTFSSENDRLKDTIVPSGATVHFNCSPTAVPAASITWFRNGNLLDANNPPAKYSFDSSRTRLTISNVSSNFERIESCVIRCEVENVHGRSSDEAILGVIDPTLLHANQYGDVAWEANVNLEFACNYTAEQGFPVNCTWYHEDKLIREGEDKRVTINGNGTLTIITEKDNDGGRSRLGTYKVIADNGYSFDQRSFKVFEKPQGESHVSHPESWWWIIFVVIAILLLLLLLLLLIWCCCCRRKNKNDYPVDKKERLVGHDPIKELDNQGFHDYQAQSGGISYTGASGKIGFTREDRPFPQTYYASEVVELGNNEAPSIHDDDISYRSNMLSYSPDATEEPEVILRRDSSAFRGKNYSSEPFGYDSRTSTGRNIVALSPPPGENGTGLESHRRHTYVSPPSYYNPGLRTEV